MGHLKPNDTLPETALIFEGPERLRKYAGTRNYRQGQPALTGHCTLHKMRTPRMSRDQGRTKKEQKRHRSCGLKAKET